MSSALFATSKFVSVIYLLTICVRSVITPNVVSATEEKSELVSELPQDEFHFYPQIFVREIRAYARLMVMIFPFFELSL